MRNVTLFSISRSLSKVSITNNGIILVCYIKVVKFFSLSILPLLGAWLCAVHTSTERLRSKLKTKPSLRCFSVLSHSASVSISPGELQISSSHSSIKISIPKIFRDDDRVRERGGGAGGQLHPPGGELRLPADSSQTGPALHPVREKRRQFSCFTIFYLYIEFKVPENISFRAAL